jgi:hypothetical protein
MNANAVASLPVNPPANSLTITPDVWVATTTAALQTYINVGKASGPASVAVIGSAISNAQSQNAISQPVAASILDLLKTSAGATLVANSVAMANKAFAYIPAHASAPVSTTPSPAQPATNVAVASGAAAHEATVSPGAQASPSNNMTLQQVIAIVESTNYVLGKVGRPAFSTAPRGVVRTADVPPVSGSGSGSGDSGDPPEEPGLESEGWANAVLGAAVTIAGAAVLGAEALDTGLEIAGDFITEGVIAAGEGILDNLPSIWVSGPPDSDGMGSGAGAPPYSIQDPGDTEGDDGDGGGGSGSGIDDKPGHQAQ